MWEEMEAFVENWKGSISQSVAMATVKARQMHCIYESWQPMKFLGISFNVSKLISKMIFALF